MFSYRARFGRDRVFGYFQWQNCLEFRFIRFGRAEKRNRLYALEKEREE